MVVPKATPLTVCPTSLVYFLSQGSSSRPADDDCRGGSSSHNFITGVSPPPWKDADVDMDGNPDWNAVDYDLFDETIWPALHHRVPASGDHLSSRLSRVGVGDGNHGAVGPGINGCRIGVISRRRRHGVGSRFRRIAGRRITSGQEENGEENQRNSNIERREALHRGWVHVFGGC